MDRPRRSVEQIEVIEHRIIEEGRRPSGGSLLPPYSNTRRINDDLDKRYEYTGERDVSREPSFLHSSANYGQNVELSPPRINHDDINNYGYDVHEIHTSGGGARVVETHGSGPLHETSRLESTRIDEYIERSPITVKDNTYRRSANDISSTAFNQVFTVPPPNVIKSESWKNISSDDSFVRKDSYKRMQQSDDLVTKPFTPQSETSLMSRQSERGNSMSGCLQRTRQFASNIYRAIRASEKTPQLMANLCCILLMLLLLLILFIIILNAIFHPYSVSEFLLYPPVCEECRRKNPNLVSASLPSSLFIHFYSSSQAHFELRGNLPFKSNSFTAIDFDRGYVAIADHALTDSNGQHIVCFLMTLDTTAISSMDILKEAVSDSSYEIESEFGWQEFWQFDAEPIEPMVANSKFTNKIEDCHNAKWYLLKQTVHSSDLSCSDCYDFCLPDWAVVRSSKYEDESTIGVRRLDCFRLYVPEWRNFRVEQDVSGGHWKYPLSSQSTKRDQYGQWTSWIPTQHSMPFNRQQRSIIQ